MLVFLIKRQKNLNRLNYEVRKSEIRYLNLSLINERAAL